MSLRLFQLPALLALLSLPILSSAQTAPANPFENLTEDQRIDALIMLQNALFAPKSVLSIGMRHLNSGAKTRFGNLGTVSDTTMVAPAADGAVLRQYNNGFVGADALRANEVDANGIQISVPGLGSRYKTSGPNTTTTRDADGNVIGSVTTTIETGDYLSYTPGLTRNWKYSQPHQVTDKPGYVGMSTYGARSDGNSATHEMTTSGGIEVSITHALGRRHKRFQWSLVTGISLNNINNKVNSSVLSTLLTRTDYYSLQGQPAPGLPPGKAYEAPTYGEFKNAAGNTIALNGLETTTQLAATPTLSEETEMAEGVIVNGNWQVKGAYFMVRVGPSLRAQLSPRWGVSATLGLAGAYAGTNYTVVESFENPDVTGTFQEIDGTSVRKFLGGYYADINLDWTANDIVGLFGGVTAQHFDDYEQKVGGRTANIDLGSAVGLRGGISIKF